MYICFQNKRSDSDSGIDNEEETAESICMCCLRSKDKSPGEQSVNVNTLQVPITTVLNSRGGVPSIASHDSGQGDDSGSPTSQTDQHIMLNVSEWPGEHISDVTDDVTFSNPTPTDGNQLESGITSYACQASPMSSMNESSASQSDGRQPAGQPTVQLPGSDDAEANANSNANVFVPSNDHNSGSKSVELIPKDVVVSCIDIAGVSDETDQEETSCNKEQRHLNRPNSDYIAMLNDSSSRSQESSIDSWSSSDESDTDPVISVIPTVNVGLENFLVESADNQDRFSAITIDVNDSGDREMNPIIPGDRNYDSLLLCQDDQQSQIDCNYDKNLHHMEILPKDYCVAEKSDSLSETPISEGVECHSLSDGESTGWSTEDYSCDRYTNNEEDDEECHSAIIVVKLPPESSI